MSNTEELKEEVLKAQQNGDIAALFMLEQKAQETFDEDTLGAFYANILDLALEKLTDALESARVMDMNEVQDFATLRVLYEYAVEHYSAGKELDASALFEVLGGLSNDKAFSEAMNIHMSAAKSKLSFESFLDDIADLDATQRKGTFYISAFNEKAQDLLVSFQTSSES